jgi:hypothetical protein
MLAFASEYKRVIKELTSDINNGLRTFKFKLDEAEWVLVKELNRIPIRSNKRTQ